MTKSSKEITDKREKLMTMVADMAKSPSKFSEVMLGHKLFKYNADYADSNERFLIYRSGRQAGKTMTTAVKTIHWSFFAPILSQDAREKKEGIVIIAAPTQNQASIMFDRIRTLVSNSKFLSKYIVRSTQTELWVQWLNKGGITKIYVRATGETGTGLRGYSPHVIIADECAFIKRSIMIAFLPSGMATNANVWLTSTPFGKQGFFYEACMNARPRMEDGLWKEFHVRSIDNPKIAEDPLFVEQVRQLSQEEYTQEVEGDFLDIGDALIPYDLLMSAYGRKWRPVGNTRYFMGVDVARSGKDETVFMIIEVDDDNNIRVIEYQKESQSNLVDVVGKMGELLQKYPFETIFIDETGLGGGVVDLARKREYPVRGVMFSLKEKGNMFSNVRMIFENKKIVVPQDDKKVLYQLSYLKRAYSEDGRLKIKTEDGAKDDHADALALACFAVNFKGGWYYMFDKDDPRASDGKGWKAIIG
jgi:phage terminase large subunit-like protein